MSAWLPVRHADSGIDADANTTAADADDTNTAADTAISDVDAGSIGSFQDASDWIVHFCPIYRENRGSKK